MYFELERVLLLVWKSICRRMAPVNGIASHTFPKYLKHGVGQKSAVETYP